MKSVNNIDSYVDSLKEIKAAKNCIIHSSDIFDSNAIFRNKEFFVDTNYLFIYIEEGISKKIADALNENLCENPHKIIKVLIHYVKNEESEEELDKYMANNNMDAYIVCASSNLSSLSILIAKLFYRNKVDNEPKSLFVNMIEPNHEIKSFKNLDIVSRKNDPLSYLINTEKKYKNLSIILHGNGENLYLGNSKLLPNNLSVTKKEEYSISDIVDFISAECLFLASCLGMKFGDVDSNTYESIINSNVQSCITFRGIKDNYFADCVWYIILKSAKYQSHKIAQIINYNIKKRTNDFPMYVAIGNDCNHDRVNIIFKEYRVKDDCLVACSSEIDSQYGYFELTKHAEEWKSFSLVYKDRIHWVTDPFENKVYFTIESDSLPKKIELILPGNLLNDVNITYDSILELKTSWSKELKNLIVSQQSQLKNLILLYNDSKLVSDAAYKFKNKQMKLKDVNKKIEISILQELVSKQTALSPISETYSPMFQTIESLYDHSERICEKCHKIVVTKKMQSIKDPNNIREVHLCVNCGQTKDISSLEVVKLKNLSVQQMFIELEVDAIESCTVYPAIISGHTEIITLDTHKKSLFRINIVNKREFDVLKLFSIRKGKLNVTYHNFRMEN